MRIRGKTLSRRDFACGIVAGGMMAGVAAGVPRARAQTPLNTLKSLSLPSPKSPVKNGRGGWVYLDSLRPRALLVNFWASWCAPCIHELPALHNLDALLRADTAAAPMAVALVGVDREGRKFGRAFLDDLGVDVPYSFYDSTGSLTRELGVETMPSSFFISPGGTVRYVLPGPAEWDDPAIVEQVKELLTS